MTQKKKKENHFFGVNNVVAFFNQIKSKVWLSTNGRKGERQK